jgi:uncharacterized repeat protein (TIGR03803 family)
MVAAWIGAAYWFTASTSFANPEGKLYGTTPFGGQTNAGVVFVIKP